MNHVNESIMQAVTHWSIPASHGDVELRPLSPTRTLLKAWELSADEERAMRELRQEALRTGTFKKAWSKREAFIPLTDSAYRTAKGVEIELDAPLAKVEAALSRALKPGRNLVRAVRFQSGEIKRVEVSPPASESEPAPVKVAEPAPAQKPDPTPKPTAAATVAQPNVGCPVPEFPERPVDARAARVLEGFLSPEQLADWRDQRAVLVQGADTGCRYLVCDRECPSTIRATAARLRPPPSNPLGRESFRQLFDLDRQRPICVHDWTVPPAEEVLALLLCLTLPGLESELLNLPHMDPLEALAPVPREFWPPGFQ